MKPQALAALLHFYADSGVDELCEKSTIDRFAQTAQEKQARSEARARQKGQSARQNTSSGAHPARPPLAQTGKAPATAAPALRNPRASQMSVPGEAAFEEARKLAKSADSLEALRDAMMGFTGCNLRHSAKTLVFADGNPAADVMIVGEAPDREEDLEGRPFVGRPGQLLDRMLASIGLDRQRSYLSTMIPWRTPGNRPPAPHEIELCRPFLERHVQLIHPKCLVMMLGNTTSKALLKTDKDILSLRGNWVDFDTGAPAGDKIPALPTLHPAHLLRHPGQKRHVWSDLLSLKAHLDALKNTKPPVAP